MGTIITALYNKHALYAYGYIRSLSTVLASTPLVFLPSNLVSEFEALYYNPNGESNPKCIVVELDEIPTWNGTINSAMPYLLTKAAGYAGGYHYIWFNPDLIPFGTITPNEFKTNIESYKGDYITMAQLRASTSNDKADLQTVIADLLVIPYDRTGWLYDKYITIDQEHRSIDNNRDDRLRDDLIMAQITRDHPNKFRFIYSGRDVLNNLSGINTSLNIALNNLEYCMVNNLFMDGMRISVAILNSIKYRRLEPEQFIRAFYLMQIVLYHNENTRSSLSLLCAKVLQQIFYSPIPAYNQLIAKYDMVQNCLHVNVDVTQRANPDPSIISYVMYNT